MTYNSQQLIFGLWLEYLLPKNLSRLRRRLILSDR